MQLMYRETDTELSQNGKFPGNRCEIITQDCLTNSPITFKLSHVERAGKPLAAPKDPDRRCPHLRILGVGTWVRRQSWMK